MSTARRGLRAAVAAPPTVLPRQRDRRLVVTRDCGVWEVRDGSSVLAWDHDIGSALRQAAMLASLRDPCRVVIGPAAAAR